MHIVLLLLYFIVLLAYDTVLEHGKKLVLFPEHDVFLSVSGHLMRKKMQGRAFWLYIIYYYI